MNTQPEEILALSRRLLTACMAAHSCLSGSPAFQAKTRQDVLAILRQEIARAQRCKELQYETAK
jgi:hypothetical protein